MHRYIKKLQGKIDTLSIEQVTCLCKNLMSELRAQDDLLDNLGVAVIALDKGGFIMSANRLAKNYITKNSTDKPLWDMLADGDMASFVKDCFNGPFSTIKKEFPVVNQKNTRYITLSVISMHFDSTLGRLIKIEDTTSAHLLEESKKRQEANTIINRAAANMAHDIKNPLGAISIHIQLLEKAIAKSRATTGAIPDKKHLDDHISVINDEIERLNSTVTSFLFATRPLDVELTSTNIKPILQNIASFYAVEFNSNNIAFVLTVDGETDNVFIDERLFRTVMANLIQNSFEAFLGRGKSDTPPAVNLLLTQKADRVIITISDNGCAIDAAAIPHIFEPYYTTKAKGTGLGLATCCKIIRAFNGEISVDSTKGVGTTFTITLPADTRVKLLTGNAMH